LDPATAASSCLSSSDDPQFSLCRLVCVPHDEYPNGRSDDKPRLQPLSKGGKPLIFPFYSATVAIRTGRFLPSPGALRCDVISPIFFALYRHFSAWMSWKRNFYYRMRFFFKKIAFNAINE
jgi:hypothetical protein